MYKYLSYKNTENWGIVNVINNHIAAPLYGVPQWAVSCCHSGYRSDCVIRSCIKNLQHIQLKSKWVLHILICFCSNKFHNFSFSSHTHIWCLGLAFHNIMAYLCLYICTLNHSKNMCTYINHLSRVLHSPLCERWQINYLW